MGAGWDSRIDDLAMRNGLWASVGVMLLAGLLGVERTKAVVARSADCTAMGGMAMEHTGDWAQGTRRGTRSDLFFRSMNGY